MKPEGAGSNMPDFFDRLGTFFKSIFSEEDTVESEGKRHYYDNDMQDAWDELEDYLNEGKTERRTREKREKQSGHEHTFQQNQARESLRDDYKNLKVPFGAQFEEVKQAYKKLLRQYHPDKHANDPQKFKMATEITSKLNQSFQRIKESEEKKRK
jgi:DNA segregation ATPase FtsK/SpoIIIE-like protein